MQLRTAYPDISLSLTLPSLDELSGISVANRGSGLFPLHRLLEVFKKLRAIAAAPLDEQLQTDLLEDAKRIVQDICSDHVAAAHAFVQDKAQHEAVENEMREECQLLVEYLETAKRFNLEINSRAKDRVVSFGERLSCRFMAALLNDRVSSLIFADMRLLTK